MSSPQRYRDPRENPYLAAGDGPVAAPYYFLKYCSLAQVLESVARKPRTAEQLCLAQRRRDARLGRWLWFSGLCASASLREKVLAAAEGRAGLSVVTICAKQTQFPKCQVSSLKFQVPDWKERVPRVLASNFTLQTSNSPPNAPVGGVACKTNPISATGGRCRAGLPRSGTACRGNPRSGRGQALRRAWGSPRVPAGRDFSFDRRSTGPQNLSMLSCAQHSCLVWFRLEAMYGTEDSVERK